MKTKCVKDFFLAKEKKDKTTRAKLCVLRGEERTRACRGKRHRRPASAALALRSETAHASARRLQAPSHCIAPNPSEGGERSAGHLLTTTPQCSSHTSIPTHIHESSRALQNSTRYFTLCDTRHRPRHGQETQRWTLHK